MFSFSNQPAEGVLQCNKSGVLKCSEAAWVFIFCYSDSRLYSPSYIGVFFFNKEIIYLYFRTVTALIIRFNILHFESEPMLFELLLKSRICFHANELSVLNVVVRTNLQILSQYWCLILPHWYKCTAAANSLLAYFSSTQWIFSPLQCLISSSAGQSSWS